MKFLLLHSFWVSYLFSWAVLSTEINQLHYEKSYSAIMQAIECFKYNGKKANIVEVLGAGSCQEIPLEKLCDRSKKVRLWDINVLSCMQAVKALPKHLQKKVEIIGIDFSFGLLGYIKENQNEFVSTIIDELSSQKGATSITFNKTKELFQPFLKRIPLPFDSEIADLTVASLVSSQLFIQNNRCLFHAINFEGLFACSMKDRYGDEYASFITKPVENGLKIMLAEVIGDLFAQIMKSTQARIIYFSDTIPQQHISPILELNVFNEIRERLLKDRPQYDIAIEHPHWPYIYEETRRNADVYALTFQRNAE